MGYAPGCLRAGPHAGPTMAPGTLRVPGGDARAARSARSARISTPITTVSTTIDTGHRPETHECGTLRTLLRRVPHSCANRGLTLGGKRPERDRTTTEAEARFRGREGKGQGRCRRRRVSARCSAERFMV